MSKREFYYREDSSDEKSAEWNRAHAYRHQPVRVHPKTIVDLGCYIGYTMVDLARSFPKATVYGAEMDPDNAAMAEKNTSRFKRCHVTNTAISTEAATIQYGGFHFNQYRIGDGYKDAPCMTLDDFIASVGLEQVDFIKMDIEGWEQGVINHGGKWTSTTKELAVEVHYSYGTKDASKALAYWGFETEVVGKELVRAYAA